MGNRKCKYAEKCIVYTDSEKVTGNPEFLVHNVFCNRGFKGWNACKRYQIYELDIDPPKDLLPGNIESIEDILSKNK